MVAAYHDYFSDLEDYFLVIVDNVPIFKKTVKIYKALKITNTEKNILKYLE